MASVGLPLWAIAVIVILFSIMCIGVVFYMLRKRLGKRGSVGADSVQKKNTTYPAARPLMQSTSTIKDSHFSSIVLNSTITPIPSPPESPYLSRPSRTHQEEKKLNRYHDAIPSPVASIPLKDDDNRSVWTEDIPLQSPEIKTSLPLPHPTSSFFADKMELDSDEAHDLYASYMNVSQHQLKDTGEFMSLEDTKHFYSSAAANIQQKAATIRNTLRQSMRRKSNTNKPAPLSQFFEKTNNKDRSDNNGTHMSRQSSSTSSRFPNSSLQTPNTTPSLISLLPPSPRPDPPYSHLPDYSRSRNKSLVSVTTSTTAKEEEDVHSTKIMIDNIPPESYFSLPVSPSTPSPLGVKHHPLPVVSTVTDMVTSTEKKMMESQFVEKEPSVNEEEVEKAEEVHPQLNEEAATAARRIIRSASKKSRTRSTAAPEESAQAMFSLIANSTTSPPLRDVSKYATVRNKASIPSEKNDCITAGSVRYRKEENRPLTLDIRNWTAEAPSHSVKTSPRRTVLSSTISGSATVSGRKRLPPLDTMPDFSSKQQNNQYQGESRSATISRSFRLPSPENIGYTAKDQEEEKEEEEASAYENRTSYLSTSTMQSAIKLQEEGHECSNSSSNNNNNNNRVISTQVSNYSIVNEGSIGFSSKRDSQASAIPCSSPTASQNNTLNKVGNNMDAIRKMLQSSWSNNNLKESGSNSSISSSSDIGNRGSYIGSVGSSSYKPVASPLGSVNPRLQNQHLVSLSLKANQANRRPAMPIDFMNHDDIPQGPEPTVSFSSSTVRTMIPAEEAEESRLNQKSMIGNILGSRRAHPPSKLGESTTKKIISQKSKFSPDGKTPAQKEREKYLKSLEA
ncbi:hypothetical protein K501DRAFT_301918 [Backusella circina FSU 941]|nr:hypothetical protein K501DRAFT_301918 [Backusella circina FSU 941]